MGNSGPDPEHDLFGDAVSPPAADGPVRSRRGAVGLDDWRV
ncbi:hypothetical protein [Streptomonospora alba]|nr:hypothetical protein [Streptomonospora alba]